MARFLPLAPLLFLVPACGGGGEQAANGGDAEAAAIPFNEAEAAALADQAAADEAADTNLFGGNAAAGETGNSAAPP